MKLFKVMVCAVSLLGLAQSAHAELGAQPKEETRAGQLLCMERATKDGRSVSSTSSSTEDSHVDTSSASAR